MASKGKRKATVNDEDRNNKAPKSDVQGEEDTITVCEISKNRKVSVRKWKNQVLIDIREYFYKGSECLPGKRGISLTMDQWNVLQKHVGEIDAAIKGGS